MNSLNLQFRRMEKQDIPFILKMEEMCFSKPWSKNQILEELENNKFHYPSVCIHGTIVGYTFGVFVASDFELLRIAVAPKKQGSGIGMKILQNQLERAKNCGASACFLEVNEKNQRAISLYQRAKFQILEIRKNYYGHGKNALNMVCDL